MHSIKEERYTKGQDLRKAREDKGMTQCELGQLVGVTGSMVSAWENGLKPICEDKWNILSSITGIDIEPLMKHGEIKKLSLWETNRIKYYENNVHAFTSLPPFLVDENDRVFLQTLIPDVHELQALTDKGPRKAIRSMNTEKREALYRENLFAKMESLGIGASFWKTSLQYMKDYLKDGGSLYNEADYYRYPQDIFDLSENHYTLLIDCYLKSKGLPFGLYDVINELRRIEAECSRTGQMLFMFIDRNTDMPQGIEYDCQSIFYPAFGNEEGYFKPMTNNKFVKDTLTSFIDITETICVEMKEDNRSFTQQSMPAFNVYARLSEKGVKLLDWWRSEEQRRDMRLREAFG